jgi:hypothetical protein
MKAINHFIVSMLLVCVFSFEAHAQKVEREKRISLEKFPSASLNMLNSEFTGRTHEKLYIETGNSGRFYESKFRYQHRKYSVKFYDNGQWLDSEKEIREDELLPAVKKSIHTNLESDHEFDEFKIIRIQEQTSVTGLRYEIEIKGKSRSKTELFEFLFDADGKYIKHEIILIESYTNEF